MIKDRKQEILQNIREIEDAVKIVEEALPSTIKDFLSLGLVKDGIYKKIEYVIENVLDICHIINSELSLGVPSDENDVIKNLGTHKILSTNIITKIHTMKSFRNILVHRYGKIDDELAFEILHEHITDFGDFKKEILRFLDVNISNKKVL